MRRVTLREAKAKLSAVVRDAACGEPSMASVRGVLAAQVVKPQARVLAESRGLEWVEVDIEILRGDREPDLTLFA